MDMVFMVKQRLANKLGVLFLEINLPNIFKLRATQTKKHEQAKLKGCVERERDGRKRCVEKSSLVGF